MSVKSALPIHRRGPTAPARAPSHDRDGDRAHDQPTWPDSAGQAAASGGVAEQPRGAQRRYQSRR